VINYILMRRSQFGRLVVVQGVKHAQDLIWRERYAYWRTVPRTEVWLAADVGAPLWPGHVGRVTELFDRIDITPDMAVLLCGPEIMMITAIRQLLARGVAPESIELSMERNMQCGHGGLRALPDRPAFRLPRRPGVRVPGDRGLAGPQGILRAPP